MRTNIFTEKIFNRPKQGFRAPVGEWIKKDQNYFYEGIYEFNNSTNLFNNKYLKSVLAGSDYQKKWYLSNLASWHLTRSKIELKIRKKNTVYISIMQLTLLVVNFFLITIISREYGAETYGEYASSKKSISFNRYSSSYVISF